MTQEMKDALLLELRERRVVLESARVAAVEHLNCVRGGIAEVEYLIAQLEAKATPIEIEQPPQDTPAKSIGVGFLPNTPGTVPRAQRDEA